MDGRTGDVFRFSPVISENILVLFARLLSLPKVCAVVVTPPGSYYCHGCPTCKRTPVSWYSEVRQEEIAVRGYNAERGRTRPERKEGRMEHCPTCKAGLGE